MTTKGIILAGGSGTRLYPLTLVTNKHLLPIFDKPMIYYPLTTLMLCGIDDILIISTPADVPLFEKLLGDGSQWGIRLSYACQSEPEGIPQAFTIGRDFIDGNQVALILGDNFFFGHGLPEQARNAINNNVGATIFSHHVNDPQRFGVISFGTDGSIKGIDEKPAHPKSNHAITGLYLYDFDVVERVSTLKPSARGELEITDLIMTYLNENRLQVEMLGRGITWLDVGTPDALAKATNYVHSIENLQYLRIACPEEVAYQSGFINSDQLSALAEPIKSSPYGAYLLSLLE